MLEFSYPQISNADYKSTPPFPHCLIDGAWNDALLKKCSSEISEFSNWDGEKEFFGSKSKKYCNNIYNLPSSVKQVISESYQPKFLKWLEDLTGEKALVPDPYLEGGGIHSIGNGGFLKIHADFNWHERLQLYRRLNILIYLNEGWKEEWNGQIELFSDPQKDPEISLDPIFNRMLIFTTDDASFHGHRHGLSCPDEVRRNSIALYYYSPIKPTVNYQASRTDTDYRPASDENFNKGKSLRSRLGSVKKRLLS